MNILRTFVHRFKQKKDRISQTSNRVDKRQKFVIAVLILSFLSFFIRAQFGLSEILVVIGLGLLTDVFLFWSIGSEVRENFSIGVFLLPFFYTSSFQLFYFLLPSRLIFRLILTIVYAIGMYSVFLSENVFVVAAIRTIALLSGARIVSFVITLLSFFFLSNIVFTLHLPLVITLLLMFVYTYPLLYQSIWSYVLSRSTEKIGLWVLLLTLCLLEAASIIWFWPSSPTVIALFLTGIFYTIGGLSHVWYDKRLFRGVLWEYVWIGTMVFFVLISFTSWGK